MRERNCQHLGYSAGTSAKEIPRSLSASDKMRAIKDLVSQGSGSGWGAARRFFSSVLVWRDSMVLHVPPQQEWASFSALLLVQPRKSNPGMFPAWQCDAWANQRKAIRPIIAMFSKRRRISEIDNQMTKYVQSFTSQFHANLLVSGRQICAARARDVSSIVRLCRPVTGSHVFLAAFLCPRFQPEIIPNHERKRDDCQSNYHPAAFAFLPAILLGLLRSALRTLGGRLW